MIHTQTHRSSRQNFISKIKWFKWKKIIVIKFLYWDPKKNNRSLIQLLQAQFYGKLNTWSENQMANFQSFIQLKKNNNNKKIHWLHFQISKGLMWWRKTKSRAFSFSFFFSKGSKYSTIYPFDYTTRMHLFNCILLWEIL